MRLTPPYKMICYCRSHVQMSIWTEEKLSLTTIAKLFMNQLCRVFNGTMSHSILVDLLRTHLLHAHDNK